MGDNFAGGYDLGKPGIKPCFARSTEINFCVKSAGKLPAAAHCKPPLSELSGLKIGDGIHVQPGDPMNLLNG